MNSYFLTFLFINYNFDDNYISAIRMNLYYIGLTSYLLFTQTTILFQRVSYVIAMFESFDLNKLILRTIVMNKSNIIFINTNMNLFDFNFESQNRTIIKMVNKLQNDFVSVSSQKNFFLFILKLQF